VASQSNNESPTRDRVEILELLSRHMLYIDLQDAQRYASLYTKDGVYESPFATARGTSELIAMSIRLTESGFTAGKRHFNGPAMIDLDGDTATAFSYWWVAETKESPGVYSTGTYTDRLQKVNGEWKIAHRKQEIDPNWPGGVITTDRSGEHAT
jgi:ketosteroid isomerase-like protein